MKKITILIALLTVIVYGLQAKDCLEEYIAKYKFPEGSLFKEINVVMENGNLSLISSMGNVVLQKNGADRFFIPTYKGWAIFKRNSANEIIGIKIEALGYVLDGSVQKKPSEKKFTEIKASTPSKVLLPKWFDEPDDLYTY
jgi:uncharacterized membrane-anchored protein